MIRSNADEGWEQAVSKPRILYLMKILYEQTDENRGLSLPEIQAHLEECGISSERKALYRDIDALNEFGFTIGKIAKRPVQYYFSDRLFERSELMLLIDAVQSSRSITQSNSEELIDKLRSLVSRDQAKTLRSQIHVSGRVKMQNDSIFDALDKIQLAIADRRDISFKYVRLNSKLEEVPTSSNGEEIRIKTPLFLTYADERYYLGVYDEDSYDHVKTYRVDRMANVLVLDDSPVKHKLPTDFDITGYERRTPGMFDEEPARVTLLVKEALVSSIVDLFGRDETTSAPYDGDPTHSGCENAAAERWAEMTVKVAPSPVFFGKIAQFAGNVRIAGPKRVVERYREHMESVLKDI